jgi:hypothetical protein
LEIPEPQEELVKQDTPATPVQRVLKVLVHRVELEPPVKPAKLEILATPVQPGH